MGKKRKASGRPFGQSDAGEIKESDSKLRIDSYTDVADSEEEFHINRDKILLDDTAEQKRRKKWREEDDLLQPSDEEVLGYSSPSSSEDDEDDDDEDADEDQATNPLPPKRARRTSNSDDEQQEEEDDEIKDWGTSRRDYYNADAIETEQDALEEEKEALRLQQRQLHGMTEADFGFDENEWMDSGKTGTGLGDQEDAEDNGAGGIITEALPQVEITEDMTAEERLRILRSRYPEFEPLAAEFLSLQSQHQDLALSAAAADTLRKHKSALKAATNGQHGGETVEAKLSAAAVKYQALTAYLGSLCMYFALLSSPADSKDGKTTAMTPGQLRDHPVMENLVKCRSLWDKVKNIRIPDSSELATTNGNELAVIEESDEQSLATNEKNAIVTSTAPSEEKYKKVKKSKKQLAAETAQAEAAARRAARIQQTEQELAQLSIPTKPYKSSKKILPTTTGNDDDNSDFGEETHLTALEAAEKAQRKKTLRFYTSQITQKSNRRDAAGNDAGGDADLPYRERFRDRQTRLNAEAEKRGQKRSKKDKPDADLGGDSDEEDRHVAKEVRFGNDEEYYDLVASSSRQRKADKKALHDAEVAAAREGGIVHVEQKVGPDGKRAIGYTIEKNKGLAPKRKKDVRNPRVKKRKKYEDKKKKLASVRQIYKGGEGRGGYGGEKTGIKGNLVKSTKL